jgi:hypothetical protein
MDPLRTTAGDGNSPLQQVTDIFRTELTPDQIDGKPADDADPEVTAAEQAALQNEDPDARPDESLEEGTEEEHESDEQIAAGTEDDVEIHDFNQLAEVIGVDMPYLYDLDIKLSDESEPIKFGEIKDRLQEKARLDADREQLQTEKSAFEQQRAQETAASSQASEELVQANARLAMINHQYQSADWDAMEKQDAGKAALYKQDLITAHQNAQYQVQQIQQQQHFTMQQRTAEMRATENAELLKHVPTWSDSTVRLAEIAEITTMAAEYGYAPQDISNVMDSRAVRMMRDLHLLKQEKAKADKTVVKVKKVPRTIKPGGTPKRVNVKKKALDETLTKAATSKDMRVKSRAVSELLQQSGALR